MRLITPLVMLLVPAIAPASQKDLPSEVDRPITIYTQFVRQPAGRAIQQMKDELDTIMGPLGLRFEWRSLESANGHDASAELMVVRFKGECQTEWLPSLTTHSGALGWTHVSDGQILPFAGVDCDRIRDLIDHTLAVSLPPERSRMLGRAMARVLAHELYHFLFNTPRHASSGIAKSAYSAGELTSEHLSFDDVELRLLRQDKLHSFLGKDSHRTGISGE